MGHNGAIVNNETKYVQLPKDFVEAQLKKVPSSFPLYGRTGEFHTEITTDTVHFATIGNPVKMYDPSAPDSSRSSTLADTITQLRIVDMCDNLLGFISMFGQPMFRNSNYIGTRLRHGLKTVIKRMDWGFWQSTL